MCGVTSSGNGGSSGAGPKSLHRRTMVINSPAPLAISLRRHIRQRDVIGSQQNDHDVERCARFHRRRQEIPAASPRAWQHVENGGSSVEASFVHGHFGSEQATHYRWPPHLWTKACVAVGDGTPGVRITKAED